MTVSTVKRAGALMITLSLLMVSVLALAGCLGDDDDDKNRAPTAVITSPEDDDVVQVGEKFKVDGRDSSDPDGDDLEFFWTSNLDGELTDESQQIGYVELATSGTHFITLKVVDPDGAEDEDEVRVEVLEENQPPVAIISSPREGDSFSENDDITFNGENSYDPDDNDAIVEYSWKIDGSVISSERRFTRQLSYGQHSAELTVKDQDGLTHTDSITSFSVTNLPPLARIEEPGDGDDFFEGDVVTFNGSKSRDPEGEDLEFEWDFGDDSAKGNEEIEEHTYDSVGDYEVTLMVTDDLDQSDNETITITIKPRGPTARMTSNVTATRIDMNISFDASDTTASGGTTITNYTWDFEDGTVITNDADNWTIEHNWTTAGYYNVTLTVTDSNEMTNETVMMVKIIPHDFNEVRNDQIILGGNGETDFNEAFDVLIFHQNVDLDVTLENQGVAALGDANFTFTFTNHAGDTLWTFQRTVNAGDSLSLGLRSFDDNRTNGSLGEYNIDIHVLNEAGLVTANPSYTIDIKVEYG